MYVECKVSNSACVLCNHRDLAYNEQQKWDYAIMGYEENIMIYWPDYNGELPAR